MAPLEDITNGTKKYDIHVKLDYEYRSTISYIGSTGRKIINEGLKAQFREEKKKCIDLWVDGLLYPVDPLTKRNIPSTNLCSFLRYVGDGEDGLLGYCRRLDTKTSIEVLHLKDKLKQAEQLISLSKRTIDDLYTSKQEQEQDLQQQIKMVQKDNIELREQVKKLKQKEGQFKTKLHKKARVKSKLHNALLQMNALKKDTVALKQRTAFKQRTSRKSIEGLSKVGGAFKKRIRATRNILQEVLGVEDGNAEKEVAIRFLLKRKEVLGIVHHPDNSNLREKVIAMASHDLRDEISAPEIVNACDTGGISRMGYQSIFGLVRKNKRVASMHVLPKPMHVRVSRIEATKKVHDLIGTYKCIEEKMTLKDGVEFQFNAQNNIFLDVKKVQAAMIKLYSLSLNECAGKAIFALKLDETEVVKGHKLERISLTLMNRALNARDGDSEGQFSVQSENNIWWLGAFELPKESHSSLKWVFHRTDIPQVIQEQENGSLLLVEGVGNFKVEWHLAGDLKTLKCMFGCALGANARHTCLYCMSTKSVLTSNQRAPPNRHLLDKDWDPVINIPLERVHFCTLHAELRILDKLLYLHTCFAWTMRPKEKATECISRLECILSAMGLHGGNVKLCKDTQLSGKTQDLPCKVSMGGAKARRLLSNHSKKSSKISFDNWKSIVQCTTNQVKDPATAHLRAKVWVLLDALIGEMRKDKMNVGDEQRFQQVVLDFTKAMVEAWGETHITHYMHIVFAHGPWFVKTQGPLAIWNTQGMEKSHYRARGAYFKSTRHGGGSGGSNALHEMFDWFFRCVNKRIDASITENQENNANNHTLLQNRLKRKRAWHSSNAHRKHQEWRSKRRRCGKRWIMQSDE